MTRVNKSNISSIRYLRYILLPVPVARSELLLEALRNVIRRQFGFRPRLRPLPPPHGRRWRPLGGFCGSGALGLLEVVQGLGHLRLENVLHLLVCHIEIKNLGTH